MALQKGELAPDFELPDETGTPRRLTDLLANGPVVLFWFPAAMTPVCTKEACHFRDVAAEFGKVGAHRVGISTDDVAKQKQFHDKHGFDYPLLSDASGEVAEQYGVKRAGMLGRLAPTKRVTFVIGTDRTILDVISSELKSADHADRALATLGAG
jgi:peroxiredoxin Q/BCP